MFSDRALSSLAFAAVAGALIWYILRSSQARAIETAPGTQDNNGPLLAIPFMSSENPQPLTLQQSTLDFIAQREGLRLNAYPDAGGYSIGYGHYLGTSPNPATCTQEQATAWLADDAQNAANAVNKFVTVPLTQNQFDALVSFAYNVGVDAFRKSTLVKKLNLGDTHSAAAEFNRWIYSQGKIVVALMDRRAAESALFSGAA